MGGHSNTYRECCDVVLALWAKRDKATNAWHPLLNHLVEVAAVASLLWDEVLAPNTRETIAKSLGLAVDEARGWSLWIAGLHDLGKASPCFQTKWPEYTECLKGLGYHFSRYPENVPHGRITSIVLGPSLMAHGLERKVAKELARLAGGHHGVFDGALTLGQSSPRAVGEGLWDKARNSIVEFLRSELQVCGVPTQRRLSGLTLIAGLTTVADWIASSEEHFPYAGGEEPDMNLFVGAKKRAEHALDRLGWSVRLRMPKPLEFRELFDITHLRPLQSECIRISDSLRTPCLVIVEAPMGEGKTEAALFLAERARQRHELRGTFIGLPTQATSNQMFGRVVQALSRGAQSGVANVLLLHGHAALSAEFEELKRAGGSVFEISAVDEDDASGRALVAAAEWFTYRKRGLLAPYGVGTVDQALMASLQAKHVFVRLLGLAGKTVVIDEVHAYDTYMSTLIERLLAWLRAIGTSVVMLSATLPDARRSAMLKAFAPEATLPSVPAPYPCLTVADGGTVETLAFAASREDRRVRIESVPLVPDDVAQWIRVRLSSGGCAAVICNTVGRAQEIYQACANAIPGYAEDGSPIVDLLNSRFPFDEREARERRTLKRFGKPGESRRPARAVLIATQVIEQSLDVDFDLMVSELPPTDLLFQRAGRLHRHQRGPRPTGEVPVLGLIETVVKEDGTPEFPAGHRYVYDEHVLLRTWMALRNRSELIIPGEIRSLIERVYSEDEQPPEDEALKAMWEESRRKLLERRERETREAESRYLPHPEGDARLDELTAMGRDEDDDAHPFFRALTRLAERSITIVCLFGKGDDLFLDRECLRAFPNNGKLTMADIRELLRRSCPVSDRRIVDMLDAIRVPCEWKKSALLKTCRPLVFDSDGGFELGRWRLTLSPSIGLAVEEITCDDL
jgi:CRISPR-associated endonuclease/helicase Cas3